MEGKTKNVPRCLINSNQIWLAWEHRSDTASTPESRMMNVINKKQPIAEKESSKLCYYFGVGSK